MDYTIVTAFYLMKSKFHPNKYKEWILNFLKLKMNCILFTNQMTKEWIESWTDLSNIHVAILDLDHFVTAKYNWIQQYKMDDEKYHTRELYMIWNEKINFLKIAKQKNPYHTEWFLWCDMGSLRKSLFHMENFTKSYTLLDLEKDKTYFFRIHDFHYHNPYFLNHLDKYLPKKCDMNVIQGGFILTHNNVCDILHNDYYDLLDKLYEKDLFIGKDQCCYLSLILQSNYTKVIEIQTHDDIQNFPDVWFFVYPFILGKSKYKIIKY
jgi:hypothetical protein